MAVFYPIVPSCQIKPLDLLLYEVFGERPHGTFVEIGAYDGESYSNTAGLADLGWQGLYVEPVPAFAERCRQRHAANAVEVVQAAVTDTGGSLTLHLAAGDTTADPDPAIAARSTGAIDVPAITPAQLAASRPRGQAPDLLVLDCEGGEGAVLRAMDLGDPWRATVIILESRALTPWAPPSARAESQALLDLLAARGWHVIWHDLINAVLVHRERLAANGFGWERAAEAHAGLGDGAAARDCLARALDLNPRAGRLWAWMAELCRAQGDSARADTALYEARRLEAERYYQALANRELRRNALDAATTAVARCQALVPDSPATLRLSARLALAKHDFDLARQHLARAAELDLWAPETLRLEADAAAAAGDDDALARTLRALIDGDGRPADRLRLARVELKQGRPAAACAALRPALADEPGNPHLLHALSESLEAQGQVDAAAEAAVAAARSGHDVGLWQRAAGLADRQGRAGDVVTLLSEAQARHPADATLAVTLSERLDTLGRSAEACAVVRRAIASGASGPELAARLDRGETTDAAPAETEPTAHGMQRTDRPDR